MYSSYLCSNVALVAIAILITIIDQCSFKEHYQKTGLAHIKKENKGHGQEVLLTATLISPIFGEACRDKCSLLSGTHLL